MSEESNQIQEENIFEDDESSQENLFDEAEETTEAPETEETPQWSLKVKYNGEERDLNEEDARTYAQKGMNYDKIYEPLERLAKANNLSVSDYLNQLNDTQLRYEVSMEVDKLREDPRYEGVSDEILEEIANSHVMENVNLQKQKQEETLKAEADASQEAVQRDVDRFLSEYPEFKNQPPEAINPKVFEYVDQGYSLLEAYEKWLRTDKVSKQNESNKKRSLGSTTNAGKAEADDFLSGFMNG